MGLFTVLAVAFVTVYAPGLFRRLPILVGGIVGYVVYLVLANGLGHDHARSSTSRRSATRPGSGCRT